MSAETTPEEQAKAQERAAEIRRIGEALIAVSEALKALGSVESQRRVLRAVAILHDVELPEVAR